MKNKLLPIFLAAITLAGCNQYLPMLDEGSPADEGQADIIVTDTAVEDASGRDLGNDTVVDECRLQILPQMSVTVPTEATVGNKVEVSAVVVDYMKGAPAGDVVVDFAITAIDDMQGNPATGDGNLETGGQYSDTQGRVSNDFFVGMTAERVYTITMSIGDCPSVEPVSVQVKVLAYDCGSLRVDFNYEGVIEFPLRDIEVFVVPSTYQCGRHIKPGSTVPEEQIIASRTAPNITSSVTFDCLPAGAYYTVFANAGAGDLVCTAAGACSRTLVIMPDQTDVMTLDFSEVTFQAAGRYNAVDHFNFEPLIEMCAGGDTTIIGCITAGAEDVGKTVCCAIQEIVKFFETPEETIVELVFDALKLWIGSAIIDAVQAVVGEAIEAVLGEVIDQWIADTPWLASFETAGADITQIISKLELESELVLEKLGSDYTVQGTHYWHALNLYWRLNCAPIGDPAYDPECGKYSLDMKDLQEIPEDFPMDLLEGSFIADVLNFNWLDLRQHEIGLSYGKLVLWAINDIFIPGISGDAAHSIPELARMWLDCAGMAAGDIGDAAESIGFDRSDVEDACNSVINTLIDPVDDMIGRLSLATTLTLTGNGRMLDDNCDNVIDRIVDGTYIGYVESNSQQASVTGDWEAERIVEAQ